MGFHTCTYAHGDLCSFPDISSGDVRLKFANGHVWEMPDMIVHYIHDHHYLPPAEFCRDVMYERYVGGERDQTKSVDLPQKVGYLVGDFETGVVADKFVFRLMALMLEAAKNDQRTQYRGS